MLVEGIKSRPVYGKLSPKRGGPHLLVAQNGGVDAVADLLDTAPPSFLGSAHVVLAGATPESAGHEERIRRTGAAVLERVPSADAAVSCCREFLATARMGTQLYVSGTEGFIGRIMVVALEAGMELDAIQTEHCGSLARRVQCVHCKGITEDVTTQPVICSKCGLTLLVRDHFSRRIGAFQGVCIDAEEPGSAPAAEEVFR